MIPARAAALRRAKRHRPAAGLQDLVGGRISMIVESLGPFLGAIQGGSLKALAVASAQRLPKFPDLPTVGETIPGFIATGWFPLLAPAGTPDWIVRKVGEDLRTVLDQPAVRQKLAQLATFARPTSRAETTE